MIDHPVLSALVGDEFCIMPGSYHIVGAMQDDLVVVLHELAAALVDVRSEEVFGTSHGDAVGGLLAFAACAG